MRPIEPLSYLPAGEPRAARPAGVPAPLAAVQAPAEVSAAVLQQPRLTRSLSFLAQSIAQEMMDSEDAAPRRTIRESAYRAAGAGPGPSISIDA